MDSRMFEGPGGRSGGELDSRSSGGGSDWGEGVCGGFKGHIVTQRRHEWMMNCRDTGDTRKLRLNNVRP